MGRDPGMNKKGENSPADPCVMVIFGAFGDLTKRKLIPTLYNLTRDGFLSINFSVVGVARRELDSAQFREKLDQDMEGEVPGHDREIWAGLSRRSHFLNGEFQDPETYAHLGKLLAEIEGKIKTRGNILFYLATPPSFFSTIVGRLGEAGLLEQEGRRWRRVVFEKPFGHDLESARTLNRKLSLILEESQIYRIDHYLGKETVQNILVFRFANGIFEPIWNRRYIDHVQITVAEDLGVEHRGGYYEEAGALRDMVPNHLFQLLALTSMEPPISFRADAVRNEKAKILNAIQPLTPKEVLSRSVRGQYGEGTREGKRLAPYRSEPRVAPDSSTETYVGLKVMIDNWRWADVPFYLRTGKRLGQRLTEIAIQFKRAPFILFRETPVDHLTANQLVLRIQPDEGISLSFHVKEPGPVPRIGGVDMNFCYADYFGGSPATGYETLLNDCMNGDATLFQRADNVESAWRVVAPILDVWKALPPRHFPNYSAGSSGPPEADELLARDGRRWRTIE